MGKYNQGIYGPYSGRVGNVIGTFWKGRPVMRIRAATHTDANTVLQQAQRMRFRLVSSFIKAHEKLVRLGYATADTTLSAFNSAMKYNIVNAVTGTFPTLKLDLTKVRLSDGNRDNLAGVSVTALAAGQIKIDWTDNSGNGIGESTDKIYLSIGSADSGEVMITDANGASRLDETVTLTLPAGWSGRTVSVIGFTIKDGVTVQATDADDVSTSANYGTVTVL